MTTDKIEVNPKIMLGKPVIKGTRLTVELILRRLGEGATESDLLDAYPNLTREDIQAAIYRRQRFPTACICGRQPYRGSYRIQADQ